MRSPSRALVHPRGALVALAACFLSLAGGARPAAAWPRDPGIGAVPVCLAAGNQGSARACSDGAGGAILVWTDARTGTADIYAQRIDATGAPLWTANGVPVCTATGDQSVPTLVSDGAGGAIMTWQDLRSGAGYDIYAQRVNASGVMQWTANGVALCTFGNPQLRPQICAAPGGAIVGWVDQRSGTLTPDIYAQAISAAGVTQWTANGVAVCTASSAQDQMVIASDGVGGAILAWIDQRSGTNYDIYAQRVNGGAVQWAVNGVAVCTATGDQSLPSILEDSRGGAYVAWQDPRAGTTNFDVYAQDLSANGVAWWPTNGVALTTATGQQVEPYLCSDGAGGVIVVWASQNATTGWDVFGSRVTSGGARPWGLQGMALCSATGDQIARSVVSDGAGGALMVFDDLRTGIQYDVYALRVLADGTTYWDPNGRPVSTANSAQQESQLVGDGADGAIVVWRDLRNGASTDVYADHIDGNGFLGDNAPRITSVTDVPNDQGGRVKVSFAASDLDANHRLEYLQYILWRSVPPQVLAAERSTPRRGLTRDPAEAHERGSLLLRSGPGGDMAWEQVEYLSAQQLPAYSHVTATPNDSTAQGNPRTAYMVEIYRYGYNPQWAWFSAPDSGYSVDNLGPAAPAPFVGFRDGTSTRLVWAPNAEPDLAGYEIHRGVTADFVPGPGTLIATQADTGYVDPAGGGYVYKLRALDVHGNASPPAAWVAPGTADAPTAATGFAFAPPVPNPARSETVLRFALPEAARVRLALYDAAGRRVRTLADGVQPAGEHAWRTALADDSGRPLAAGLYLARLEAGAVVRTQRLAVIR